MNSIALMLAALFLVHLPSSASAQMVREVPLPEPAPCVTPEEWAEIRTESLRNLDQLRRDSKLPPAEPSCTVLFEWPLRSVAGLGDHGYHATAQHYDHDPGLNDRLDYECGTRTYDGHNGTDYITWPFWWYKMDHDQVEVIAAADGVIFDRRDGHDDRSCAPGGTANIIAIRHADGTMAWYLHMKKWSLTSKQIGETVVAGEYLGIVGSSGNSGLPHLHFDLRDANWNSFDPYEGPCNEDIFNSRWGDQRPYFDSAINALLTHSSPPVFPPCPEQEILNLQDTFAPTDSVHIGIYHRHLLLGQEVHYSIFRPDGAIADSGSYSSQYLHLAVAHATPAFLLPGSAPPGVWRVEVDYLDEQYEQVFTVDGAAGLPAVTLDSARPIRIGPNPFASTVTLFIDGTSGPYRMQIFDSAGRLVHSAARSGNRASDRLLEWDGRDDAGRRMSAGIYFIRVQGDGEARTGRVLLLR